MVSQYQDQINRLRRADDISQRGAGPPPPPPPGQDTGWVDFYTGEPVLEGQQRPGQIVRGAGGLLYSLEEDPAYEGLFPRSLNQWEVEQLLYGPGGSGSGSTPRDAAAQAYDAAAAQRLRDQTAIDRERIAQDRYDSLLNSATSLADRRLAIKDAAMGRAVEYAGKDDFRLAAALQGKPAGAGPTPADAMKSQNRALATMPVADINPLMSVNQLESAVAQMGGHMPNNVTPFPFSGLVGNGMAEGGMIGQSGPQFGGQGYSVMVGDRKMNGDEEIATMRPDGTVIITPLVGRAADGAVLPPQPATLPQAFQSYENLNLTTIPEQFANLRNSMRGNTGITTTATQSGAEFGRGLGQLYGPLTLDRGLQEALTDPALAARMSALIGQLPNPRNAANIFMRLNPADARLVKGAYALAGIDNETFDALVSSALIGGGPQQAVAFG